MRLYSVVISVFLIIITHICPVAAQDVSILIDGSASMKGFAQTGSIQQVVASFREASSKAGLSHTTKLFLCGRDRKTISYQTLSPQIQISPEMFSGLTTVLDTPLGDHASAQKALILITDNVDNSTGVISTDRFYNSIQNTETMRQLTVIPLIRAFSGNPCVIGAPAVYTGNRGMMAYMVIYVENYKRYSLLRKILREQGFDLLHFYPITADHLKIEGQKKARTDYSLKSVGQKYILTKDQRMQLSPPITTGKFNDIRFSFDLSSKYEHFYLKKGTAVSIVNLKVRTKNGDIPIKTSYTITPTELKNDLNPDGTKQSFSGVLKIKPEPSLGEEALMAISRPYVQISFDIILKAHEGGLSLTPDINSKVFTNNPLTLSKIFSKNDLLSMINPYANRIVLSVQNLNGPKYPESSITIRSSRESLFITCIVGIIVLILILLYALRNHFSARAITVFEDDKQSVVIPRGVYRSNYFSISNNSRVRIRIIKPGWQLSNHVRSQIEVTIMPGVVYNLHDTEYTTNITIKYTLN